MTHTTAVSKSLTHSAYLGRAEAQQIRDQLAQALAIWLQESRMTQEQAARFLGTSQARISNIKCGNSRRFTIDILIRFATRAGLHTALQIRRHTHPPRVQ